VLSDEIARYSNPAVPLATIPQPLMQPRKRKQLLRTPRRRKSGSGGSGGGDGDTDRHRASAIRRPRRPHITLKSIANNAEIDVIWEQWQKKLDPLREKLNAALKKTWQEWEVQREADAKWSDAASLRRRDYLPSRCRSIHRSRPRPACGGG
jgi:hypothetical protein